MKPEIDTLLLIDRDVDLVTPMVTPLTYEALIDDIIGIESGSIKVDAAMLGDSDPKTKKPAVAGKSPRYVTRSGVSRAPLFWSHSYSIHCLTLLN